MRIFVHLCSRTGSQRVVKELENDKETVGTLMHAMDNPKKDRIQFPDRPSGFRISGCVKDQESNLHFYAIRAVPMQ